METLFYERLKTYFGDDYEKVLAKLKEEAKTSIFLNIAKAPKGEIAKFLFFEHWPSKINPLSYYYRYAGIGKTKAYDLGLIYPQELSASLPSLIPDTKDVKIVLDMCAAPGGKSINILNRLNDDAILIANEIDYKRAQVLTSNLERLGFGNVIITNKRPEELLVLRGKIDLLILDAPCSGEGMVKKYPEIIEDYNINHILNCAKTQKELLKVAYELLKPGGQLIYSTCTYAPEEDEQQIKTFLNDHEDLYLKPFKLDFKTYEGMAKMGFLDDMEGQFMAYMQKSGSSSSILPMAKTVKEPLVEAFIKDNLSLDKYYLYRQKDRFFLSLVPLPDLGSKIMRMGVYLGEIVAKRFEPAHHLYRANNLRKYFIKTYDLNDRQYDDFIKGAELGVDLSDGYYLLSYQNLALGFGKVANKRLKNKYPKGLRRMI